jgi:hypothetical protein
MPARPGEILGELLRGRGQHAGARIRARIGAAHGTPVLAGHFHITTRQRDRIGGQHQAADRTVHIHE